MTHLQPTTPPTLWAKPSLENANPRGDIFGGWLMGQIDIAGSIPAKVSARGPVATIAVKRLTFKAPLYVDDEVSLYARVTAIGKKAVTVDITVYAKRAQSSLQTSVFISHAVLVYVAILRPGQSRSIDAV